MVPYEGFGQPQRPCDVRSLDASLVGTGLLGGSGDVTPIFRRIGVYAGEDPLPQDGDEVDVLTRELAVKACRPSGIQPGRKQRRGTSEAFECVDSESGVAGSPTIMDLCAPAAGVSPESRQEVIKQGIVASGS